MLKAENWRGSTPVVIPHNLNVRRLILATDLLLHTLSLSPHILSASILSSLQQRQKWQKIILKKKKKNTKKENWRVGREQHGAECECQFTAC